MVSDLTGARTSFDREAFERDGFAVLPGYFSREQIDAVEEAMAKGLHDHAMEVVVDDVRTGERTFYGLADRVGNHFKISDLYLQVAEMREIALGGDLARLLQELKGGEPPVICNSLTLTKGSTQAMHIDSLFMTPRTPKRLIASWVALEDVHPDAGPLSYYRGSHQIPLYRFRDGGRHANNDEMPEWTAYIARQIEERQLKKEVFLARKGDLFIWHSDLLHGGEPILDQSRTRRTLVYHYYDESDCREMSEIELMPYNGGFWMERAPQGVKVAPDRFDAGHPFPENNYLRRWADLREAVANGIIKSGFDHYCRHGYEEGRLI